MTPLRILFAIHGPADRHTAVYSNVLQRAEFLRAAGHHVDVVTPGDLPLRGVPRLDPIVLPLLVLKATSRRYDVVLFHSYLGWAFHLLRTVLDRNRTVATVTMFHGLEPLYHHAASAEMQRAGTPVSKRFRLLHHVVVPKLLRFSCRRSDRVICLNQAERRYLVHEGWADDSRIGIVANGVEPALFTTRTHRPRGSALVFVGQWLPPKGTRYLVEAFSALVRRHPDLRLACVGGKVPIERVLADFPEDVRRFVSVQPEVDREQLAEALRAADVFLFPSVYEGFGNVLVEAMAAGLPIVSTGVGAAADLLENEKSAFLIDVGDAAALTQSVERLIDAPSLRVRLAAAAQGIARMCTWDRVNADYARNVYAAVSARRAAGGDAAVRAQDVG